MFKEGLLKGKRILITGGGTGLGKEIATRYLQLGAEVWIAGRRGGVLESCSKELTDKYGGTVKTHSVDIRDSQAVDAMVQRIWDEAGPLTPARVFQMQAPDDFTVLAPPQRVRLGGWTRARPPTPVEPCRADPRRRSARSSAPSRAGSRRASSPYRRRCRPRGPSTRAR